ncbi:18212_t:CDS:2, partial [Racocetra persica]
REILDGKDRTPASSSLLVKELSAPVSKECIEPHRKRESKTLQTKGRTNGVVGGGVKSNLGGTHDRNFGHPYSSIKELSERAKQLAKNAVSPSTKLNRRRYFGVHYVARRNGPGATNPQSPTGGCK